MLPQHKCIMINAVWWALSHGKHFSAKQAAGLFLICKWKSTALFSLSCSMRVWCLCFTSVETFTREQFLFLFLPPSACCIKDQPSHTHTRCCGIHYRLWQTKFMHVGQSINTDMLELVLPRFKRTAHQWRFDVEMHVNKVWLTSLAHRRCHHCVLLVWCWCFWLLAAVENKASNGCFFMWQLWVWFPDALHARQL